MRRVGIAVAAAVLLALPGEAAGSKRLADACAKEGPVRAGSAWMRVHGDRRDGEMRACSLENGRRIGLGDNSISSGAPSYVRPIAVAKRVVAWHRKVCSRQSCGRGKLVIADVPRGRRLFERTLPEGLWVDELVVWASGSAAWIEASPDGTRTLHRRYQDDRVLARGDVRELALSADRATLYWLENGLPRSTPLLPGALASPEEEKRPRCGTTGATHLSNAWARVWTELGDAFYACSYESPRREVELGESSSSTGGFEEVGAFSLAGRLVARFHRFCFRSLPGASPQDQGVSCNESRVDVHDVRTGERRTLAEVPADEHVSETLLKRNRSIAIVQENRVRLVDAAGDRVVGTGSELALSHGSTLFWTMPGGAPAAAPLK